MLSTNASSVDIVAENTGEIRLYIAQYFSPRKQKMIREYADAVCEADLAAMSSADRAKVQFFGLVNLGKETVPELSCSSRKCRSCDHAAESSEKTTPL